MITLGATLIPLLAPFSGKTLDNVFHSETSNKREAIEIGKTESITKGTENLIICGISF